MQNKPKSLYSKTRFMFSRPNWLIAIIWGGLLLSKVCFASDLLDVVRAASSNDPSLLSAQALHQANLEKPPQSRALLRPNVALSANLSANELRQNNHNNGLLSNQSQYQTAAYNLTLVQPIYRKQNWLSYELAELQTQHSELTLKQTASQHLLVWCQAYFDVLFAQDKLGLLKQQHLSVLEQGNAAKARFNVGKATITDSHEANARERLLSAQINVAENQLTLALHHLQQLTGTTLTPLAKLKDKPVLPSLDFNEQTLMQLTEQQNLGLMLSQLAVVIAQKQREKEQAAHLPTLDLSAGLSQSFNRGDLSSDNRSNNLTLTLNLPLYSGGAPSAKVRETQAYFEQAQQQHRFNLQHIQQQFKQAYLAINSSQTQLAALSEAEQASKEALKASQIGLEVGVRTNLDVLNSQQQYFATQIEIRATQYQYLTNWLNLHFISGQLDQHKITQVNSLLN